MECRVGREGLALQGAIRLEYGTRRLMKRTEGWSEQRLKVNFRSAVVIMMIKNNWSAFVSNGHCLGGCFSGKKKGRAGRSLEGLVSMQWLVKLLALTKLSLCLIPQCSS